MKIALCCTTLCCQKKANDKKGDDDSTEGSDPLMTDEDKKKAMEESKRKPNEDKTGIIIEAEPTKRTDSDTPISVPGSGGSLQYSGLVPHLLKSASQKKSVGDDNSANSDYSGLVVDYSSSSVNQYNL